MTMAMARKLAVLVSTLGAIGVNVLANVLPINGQNTGEISDRFAVFFVPAGYVFAIWGLIYIGMLVYAVYQALPAQAGNARLEAAGWWFSLGNLANAAWIFMWHYNLFGLSLVFMLVLLSSLVMCYVSLGIGRRTAGAGEIWAVFVPVSVYLGWISVATIANATDVLYDLQWDGFGLDAQLWAVVMLGVALVVGGLMAVTRADRPYLLVFVWAFAGIGVKQAAYPTVAVAAWVAAGLAAGLVLAAGWLQKRFFPVGPG
jgi:hypothetical protein